MYYNLSNFQTLKETFAKAAKSSASKSQQDFVSIQTEKDFSIIRFKSHHIASIIAYEDKIVLWDLAQLKKTDIHSAADLKKGLKGVLAFLRKNQKI